MKFLSLFLLALPFAGFVTVHTPQKRIVENLSPLAGFSPEWNNPRYNACNTAANADYLSAEDKNLIYFLNLMRSNPTLFANTVLHKYTVINGKTYLQKSPNYSSLMQTLRKTKPLNLLYPDSLCFISADCHAINAGLEGYIGHQRSKPSCEKKWYYNGECCDYGSSTALDILMDLMIDEGEPSLGHRKICLSPYNKVGVSIQPHKTYGSNAVLDFHY